MGADLSVIKATTGRGSARAAVSARRAAGASGKQIAGIGRVYFWNGGSLWIGRDAGRGHPHSHHAIQITLALEGGFLLREREEGDWSEFRGAIVLPHCRHQFDGCGRAIAQVFVEPETEPGRALVRSFAGAGIAALPLDTVDAMLGLLHACHHNAGSGDASVAAAQSALALLTGPVLPGTGTDPRMSKAIAQIHAQLGGKMKLSDAAAAAHLSPSRFRHLFTAQTGTVFRAYVLWLRLNLAIRTAMEGHSWTVAAHEAGFADSAHLTRTFRRMFGIAPAMLVIDKQRPDPLVPR
jgi:AraC family transcriptional regulator